MIVLFSGYLCLLLLVLQSSISYRITGSSSGHTTVILCVPSHESVCHPNVFGPDISPDLLDDLFCLRCSIIHHHLIATKNITMIKGVL